MTPFLAYLVKVIICSGILYAYYHAALRNNRFHQWNRFYLLGITILSLVVPLMRIPLSLTGTEAPDIYVYTAQVATLREQVFTVQAPQVQHFNLTALLYGIVISLLVLRIGWGYFKILQLVRTSHIEPLLPYRLVLSKQIAAPFSFFRFIFWNSGMSASTPEGRQMLRHEIVHLQENHSTDKLFMEVVTAVCWINPFFHLVKRELSLVHEFIADKRSVENGDVATYAQTILHAALQAGPAFNLTNNFSHQPIKRRILMLTQSRNFRFSYLRRILILPVAVLIFSSLAFVTEDKMDRLSENLSIPVQAPEIKTEQATDAAVAPDSPAPENKKAVTAVAETAPVPAAQPIAAPIDTIPKNEEIFTMVEQPPTFKGGDDALGKYLSNNIRYPISAIEKNISGTVFVNFVVAKDGHVTNIKTVGAPKGGGLEEEAIRVVKAMPAWNPAKQNGNHVNMLFNLPIRFTLQNPLNEKPDKDIYKPNEKGIYSFVEQPPTYKGGDEALNKYLSKTIRYPQEATKKNIQGTVFVSFIVDEKGVVKDIKTVGAPKGGGLEQEAIRVVKGMPDWTPGKHHGENVSVQFNLPLQFKLHN
ncbi:M56 family metallopeptidase [Chitinophaga barathri]|uniref:TonB family protein n=1 Tax=Chitinophaga barathri TaxID=1647451 RepID=A0A3N4MK10_9BACT|nr:M56 family metallopeptidase [Chitinophaga barathri]RPD42406.1 TonB family protein [Chitinophaga barathri]